MTVFGTEYSENSNDDSKNYTVEYVDNTIVITLNNLTKTLTTPFIVSTSDTPITVKLNGISTLTAGAGEDFTFIKSVGNVTIVTENKGELTIVPANDEQALAHGGRVTNKAVINFRCPDSPDSADGISFKLGADFIISADSEITLDNNFTLVVDGTHFKAESSEGASSRIRCAGDEPCRGIIDIRGAAEAVFNGNIGDRNINGKYALERYIQIRLSEGTPDVTLANPDNKTSIGNVGFSIQAGEMTLGSESDPTIFLAYKSEHSIIEVVKSGQLKIAGYVQMGSQKPYLTLSPDADYDYSPLVVQSKGQLDNHAVITGVSGCNQPLILIESKGELHNYNDNSTIRLQVGGDTEDTSTLLGVKDGGTLKLASPNTNSGKLCVIDDEGNELDSIGYTLVSAEESSDVEFGNSINTGSTLA